MKLSAWTRSILSLSIAAIAMAADDGRLRIDHATVCGSELEPMKAALEKLGLHVEYGGPHANGVTEMALASFPDGSYLELIALQRNADPAAVDKHYWAKYMRGEAGPCAWAVRPDDIGAEVARLTVAGVPVSEPRRSGRTRPDGLHLEWETAQVGTAGEGVFFPFLIKDFTPRDKRAFPSGRSGNPKFVGVTEIIIAAKSMPEAKKRFQEAYGPLHLSTFISGEYEIARFADTPVRLISDKNRVDRFGEGVQAFGIKKAASNEVIWIEPKQFQKPLP